MTSEIGWETHLKFREGLGAYQEVWDWLGGPPGGLGVVRRLTQRSRRGREAHPEFWEGSGGLSKTPGEVGRPTWRAKRCQESHSVVRVGS